MNYQQEGRFLQSPAYHEAGHAVLAYRLDFQLGPVTIKPDEAAGTLGTSASEGEWADGSRDADAIVVLFAGHEAERRHEPEATPDGSERDDAKAAELLKVRPDLDAEQLRARTRELVARHWSTIEAVAEALLEWETLPEDDLYVICETVDEGEDWRDTLAEYRQRRACILREGGSNELPNAD